MSEIDLSSPLNYGTPSSLGSIRTPRSGIRGTPIRMRAEVRSDKRIRQVNVAGDAAVSTLQKQINYTGNLTNFNAVGPNTRSESRIRLHCSPFGYLGDKCLSRRM